MQHEDRYFFNRYFEISACTNMLINTFKHRSCTTGSHNYCRVFNVILINFFDSGSFAAVTGAGLATRCLLLLLLLTAGALM